MENTEALISRELDLVKVVTQLRMLAVATLGTLTPQRRTLAFKLAQIEVNDSNTDTRSADLEGTFVCQRDVVAAIRHLSKSRDSTDRRFLDLTRIKTDAHNPRNAYFGMSDSSLAAPSDQNHTSSQIFPEPPVAASD